MYCNITQLSVKKKKIKELKIIFLCTVHIRAALSSPFISMGQNVYRILSVFERFQCRLVMVPSIEPVQAYYMDQHITQI